MFTSTDLNFWLCFQFDVSSATLNYLMFPYFVLHISIFVVFKKAIQFLLTLPEPNCWLWLLLSVATFALNNLIFHCVVFIFQLLLVGVLFLKSWKVVFIFTEPNFWLLFLFDVALLALQYVSFHYLIILYSIFVGSFLKNNCQAQPKPKPNHSWAVLVLNPTSPTVHPAVRKSMKLVLLS